MSWSGWGSGQAKNPLVTVRKLKFDETEMAYLEADEIRPLLDALAAEDSDAGLIADVCLSTGARWGGG